MPVVETRRRRPSHSSYLWEKNQSQNDQQRHRRESHQRFVPPSRVLLDPLPSPPTADNPDQRVIGRIDRPALKLYLRLLASGDTCSKFDTGVMHLTNGATQPTSYAQKRLSKQKTRRLGDKLSRDEQSEPTAIQHESGEETKEDPLPSRLHLNEILESGINEETRMSLAEHRLTLADFRPLSAPFVPEVLKVLVNSIEAECHASNWEPIFTQYSNLRDIAELHACLLIQNYSHLNHIKRQVNTLTLPLKIMTMRTLLSGFKQKPLHFNRRLLIDAIERPLFDQFLRPNPKIRSIVKHTALPCNRTTMDTLAYLMIHFLHAWEYASNPLTAKLKLARLYGPLMVSFAERPVVLDQDPSDYKSEEAPILEVVLEVCNSQFWDNLSMLQLRRAFTYLTRLEQTRLETRKNREDHAESLLTVPIPPDEIEDSDYENEAWFSYLFPNSTTKKELQDAPANPSTQKGQFDFNRYEDCRLLARLRIKERPKPLTEEQTVERFKARIAEAMHGEVAETQTPRYVITATHLAKAKTRNLYVVRKLRSTEELLNDIKHSSRLLHNETDRRYTEIASKVDCSLIGKAKLKEPMATI